MPEGAIGAGAPHLYRLRVYYEDTDAAGVVYYANYLKFAERARTEFLRDLGVGNRVLLDEAGVTLQVRRCVVDYLAAARLEDELVVESRIAGLRGATIEALQSIRRGGLELARLQVTVACVARTGRPTRIPQRLACALAAQLADTNQPQERKLASHG